MLGWLVLCKIGDKLVDYAQVNVRRAYEFRPILDSLQNSVNSLSAKASDVDDQIKNGELSGKKKRKREVEEWLKQVQIIESELRALENEVESEGFVSRFLGGDRPAKLKERVDELVGQGRHFGELVIDVYEIRGDTLLTTRLIGKAFEENMERIWKSLVIDKVSRIGIYGMGGVGKTTLTKHIHNKLLKELTQECVFWVTVSQESSIMKLQDEIARVIKWDLSDERDEDKRATSLHRALSQRKNFVLILDDVWKCINLQKLGDPLGVGGGRLMITTRSRKVCLQIGCKEVIEVKILQEDEAWELFSETLRHETIVDPEIQEVAKSMAKLCDGLPLGIITVAGGMKGETDVRVWRDALTQLKDSVMGQYEMEDKVFKVLKYSFDRLDPYEYTELQHCFLYCSLYPEDHEIEREELIRRFISEDLVGKRKRIKEQFDKGHSILNKLVNLCLLEGCGTKYVKMHDLVRAMALRITEGKTMVKVGDYSNKEIPNEGEWTEDLEKVSLMSNGIEEIPAGVSPNCPKLSTLLLQRNQSLNSIADSFFSQMHGLRTLDLSGTIIKELPNSLCNLESLEALILQYTKLEYAPYLGKLKGLKHLDLAFTNMRALPQEMEELINLKWLLMYGAYKLETLPRDLLLNFRYLQHLSLPDQIEAPADEMERLEELEEFQGRLKDVCDFNRFIISRQSKGVDASYFVLVADKPLHYVAEEMTNCKEVYLNEYDFKKGEEKDVAMLAHDIQHLNLNECEGLSKCLLDDFINPKSVETLVIGFCKGIECIMRKEELMGAQELSTPHPQAIFASLKVLSIVVCEKMKKLGIPVSEFPNIESVSVSCCDEIEEIIQVAEEDDHVSLPKLKSLYLIHLPNLKSICNATVICTSIQRIELWRCPALKKVSLCFPRDVVNGQVLCSPPPALKEIRLLEQEREWWESLEWNHPSHELLLQPFLQFNGSSGLWNSI